MGQSKSLYFLTPYTQDNHALSVGGRKKYQGCMYPKIYAVIPY